MLLEIAGELAQGSTEECLVDVPIRYSDIHGSERVTRLKEASPELIKELCTEFYYWWHNQPGNNTQQGFDEWWRLNHKRFGYKA